MAFLYGVIVVVSESGHCMYTVLNVQWAVEVPCMVALHCNGRTYLITFRVGPLSTYTFALLIQPLLEALAEIFESLAITFHFISSMVAKCAPLQPVFSVWNSQM
jgi:hypothetical protein